MPRFPLPGFNDIALLRSIAPQRLRLFLLRFSKYLLDQGLTIPAADAFNDTHFQHLIAILSAADVSSPAEFIEALYHVSELANDPAMASLLLLASKNGIQIPDDDITSADLALLVWMQEPDLLRRANCERIVLRFQSFYCYMNRTLKAPRFMLPCDLVIRKMEDSINQHNCNRSRGGGAAVWMYEIQHEVAFLIRSGGNIRRDEVMDQDVCRPDSLQSTCREDPAIYAAAKRLWGSWRAAREAAGFPVAEKRDFHLTK